MRNNRCAGRAKKQDVISFMRRPDHVLAARIDRLHLRARKSGDVFARPGQGRDHGRLRDVKRDPPRHAAEQVRRCQQGNLARIAAQVIGRCPNGDPARLSPE